jgi:anti-sigma regulatory factor (Ser/Thr protein kinase)
MRYVGRLESQAPRRTVSLKETVLRHMTFATLESDLDLRIRIDSAAAVVFARQKGRHLARRTGFTSLDSALIATAVSELARCVLRRAGDGEIVIRLVQSADGRQGIALTAHDEGRSLSDPQHAVRQGRLGLGLSRVVQLMDDVQADSDALRGTTITVTKWLTSWPRNGFSGTGWPGLPPTGCSQS